MHSAVGLSSLDLYNIKTTLHELLMGKNIDMLCGMKGVPKYVVWQLAYDQYMSQTYITKLKQLVNLLSNPQTTD
jgi:hypothetical protein